MGGGGVTQRGFTNRKYSLVSKQTREHQCWRVNVHFWRMASLALNLWRQIGINRWILETIAFQLKKVAHTVKMAVKRCNGVQWYTLRWCLLSLGMHWKSYFGPFLSVVTVCGQQGGPKLRGSCPFSLLHFMILAESGCMLEGNNRSYYNWEKVRKLIWTLWKGQAAQ